MWFELGTEELRGVTCEATFRPALWQKGQLASLPSLDALLLGLTWPTDSCPATQTTTVAVRSLQKQRECSPSPLNVLLN